MPRFEPAGDAFLTASHAISNRLSPEELGEVMPDYRTQYPSDAHLIYLPYLPTLEHYLPQKNDFRAVIEDRRTNRRYDTSIGLSQLQLSWLLWATQGVTGFSQKKGVTIRNVPSAGSRHPFETYLVINRVEGLPVGLYHYVPQKHAIYLVDDSLETLQAINASTFEQKQVVTASVNYIWVAEVYRTSWRYQERAYRYLFIDAGHVCQNLYLAAESEGNAVCAIGAYKDDEANQALGLDGHEKFVIYMASVGKPKRS